MSKQVSDFCSNPDCKRKFGDEDDRKPGKIVKKGAKTSALCGICFYERYYKENEVKKQWMKDNRKRYHDGKRTNEPSLFESLMGEIDGRKIQQ